jgi:hypothetical protein
MSTDLIALAIALTLGTAVVILGLRRNLSETTREGLPQFGGGPEGATATLGLYEGEERKRRPLSPRQGLWVGSLYLLFGLGDAVFAVLSSENRLLHALTAAGWALGGVALLLRASLHPSGRSAP